jgi:hypothetical protein
VANDLGVSARTIKRRIDRMAAEGSIDVLAVIDPGSIEGVVPAVLVCLLREDADAAKATSMIQEALGPAWVYAWPGQDDEVSAVQVAIQGASPADLDVAKREVASLPVMKEARLDIPSSSRLLWSWMDDAIAARVEGDEVPVSLAAARKRQDGHSGKGTVTSARSD